MAATKYTVKWGDTLSEIAVKYNTTTAKLAKWNDIKDINKIVAGQVLYVTAPSSSEKKKTTTPNKVAIKAFGLQTKTDRTMYVTWTWSKKNTKEYQVIWYYATGDGVKFIGNDSKTTDKQSTYNAPSNATKVYCKIKPISKTYTKNGKETNYWTASWSSEVSYAFSNNPPTTPSVPSVEVDGVKITAKLNNLDVNGSHIIFQIVKDDKTVVVKEGKAAIVTSSASYSYNGKEGSSYKVRCRAYRQKDKEYSDWTDYSDSVYTKPSAPSKITSCKANSETSVYLEWSAVSTATKYEIEYTTEKSYFNNSSETTTVSTEFTHHEITGLESGDEYFFRVRAVNKNNETSSWSSISSAIVGKKPSPPTTWSSTTTAIVGEPLILYWIHNSEDGSSQTEAKLKLNIGGNVTTLTIKNSTDEEEKDKTSSYTIDTSSYTEGTTIKWSVQTKGIIDTYSDSSIERTVDIYAQPTLDFSLIDSDSESIDSLESFPFYASATAGPSTQTPIGYHLTVIANESYETIDQIGNSQIINEGTEVYSKYFDISEDLMVELSASNIDLENNISYTAICVVSMDSGLTAESSMEFTVAWADSIYEPNAEISINTENLTASIRPYCEYYPTIYYKVVYTSGTYTMTTTELDELEGDAIDGAYTADGEMVYSGTTASGESVYFCMIQSEEGVLADNVTLSVYRREFDGEFVELATDIDNSSNISITDPHPSLDYARYRIVAIDNSTGSVSFYDMPGYPVGEKAAIIQWDEEWSYFDVTNEDELEQQPWSGSLLRLPYNIDVSDKYSSDVSHVEYIGREHPVSYYGTQIGETSSLSMEIEKSDKDTLYALRRLSRWMGDVYVREPSGSGYWASVSVSFSQTHCELTIPVTMDVTRVEGGA